MDSFDGMSVFSDSPVKVTDISGELFSPKKWFSGETPGNKVQKGSRNINTLIQAVQSINTRNLV
jgi:hypothetical protein